MIFDASVIISVLIKEPGADALFRKIEASERVGTGSQTDIEAA